MTDGSAPGTIGLLTKLAKGAFRLATEERLGMRMRQHHLLAYLSEHGPIAQRDLVGPMYMDASNLVLLLNEVEQAGYVERRRDPDDRRRHIVELTQVGRDAIARAQAGLETVEDDVLAALDSSEREQLHALLARAFEGLRDREPVAGRAA
jgi:DNA-binding MarR family transcriptional regulator